MSTPTSRVQQLRKGAIAKASEGPPPHAPEAEAAVLGKLIIDCHKLVEVSPILPSPSEFYEDKHRAIYGAMLELYKRDGEVAIEGLVQHLRDLGKLDEIGGARYLNELAESEPHASGIAYYAKLVAEKARRRRYIDVLERALHAAVTEADPVDDLMQEAEGRIFQLSSKATSESAEQADAILDQLHEDLANNGGGGGLATGFADLDGYLGGLQPGEMVVVAARPSAGKSAIAQNIAEHISRELREPVAFFSMEMSKTSLMQRHLSARSGIGSHRIRERSLDLEDWTAIQKTIAGMRGVPLFVDDTPALTLPQLRAKVRRMVQRHGIKVVFIDYLQLMSVPGAAKYGRQQEVSELSRGIKALARDFNVPVVCLSQLNRGPESRENHRPRMSDLRESGAIEQDADVVLLLHREDYYHQGDPGYQADNVAELIIAKHRNGPTGTVRLRWNPEAASFYTRTTSYQYDGGMRR